MVEFPDLTARVVGLSSSTDWVDVEVDVVKPAVGAPPVAELRARGRALMSTGVVPTTVDRVEDLTMGELERFTEVLESRKVEERRRLGQKVAEVHRFKIRVNRD